MPPVRVGPAVRCVISSWLIFLTCEQVTHTCNKVLVGNHWKGGEMAAQQKPKKDKGVRNLNRKSGKAQKKSVATREYVNFDGEVTAETVRRYGDYGQRVTGRCKPSGNSVCGISIKRVRNMAEQQKTYVAVVATDLETKRTKKREMGKAFRASERRTKLDESGFLRALAGKG